MPEFKEEFIEIANRNYRKTNKKKKRKIRILILEKRRKQNDKRNH